MLERRKVSKAFESLSYKFLEMSIDLARQWFLTILRTFRFSIATKSLDCMTRWANLHTQSLRLRET
jgi:hypothetical protein